MRHRIQAIVLLAGLAAAIPLLAHEGHAHKVMGTVASVHAESNQVQIQSTDGTMADVVINEKTRYLHGRRPTTVQDLRPGVRVVVMYQEEAGKKVATEVRLAGNKPNGRAGQAPAAPPAPKKPGR